MTKIDYGLIVAQNELEILWYDQNAEKLLNLSRDMSAPSQPQLESTALIDGPEYEKIERGGKTLRIQRNKISIGRDRWTIITIHDVTDWIFREKMDYILEKMLDYVQDALYVVDPEGNEIFHKNIERFTPGHRQQMIDELMTVFKTGRPIVGKYRRYLTRDQRPIHMLSTAIPVKKGEKIIGAILVNNYINRMRKVISKAVDLQNQTEGKKHSALMRDNGTRYAFDDLKSENKDLKAIVAKARKASSTSVPILLYGETGTGKEIFAQSIHNQSVNREEMFVAVNCAAIPETLMESLLFGTVKGVFTGAENNKGLLEQAGKGTLFLDEINSMSIDCQAKLLRVLQEKRVRKLGGGQEIPVFCRVISAINTDPQELIRKKKLREDFFYRIAVVTLQIPPLRNRKEDILLLSHHFIKQFNKIYEKMVEGLSWSLENIFLNHAWPGNVRELRHILEGAFNLIESEKFIRPAHIPDFFQCQPCVESVAEKLNHTVNVPLGPSDHLSLPEQLKTIEAQIILNSIQTSGGNIAQSARMLGIHRQNLQARMKKLNIKKQYIF